MLGGEGTTLTTSQSSPRPRFQPSLLWAAWILVALALAGWSRLTLLSREQSILGQRREQLRSAASDLRGALESVEKLPFIALREALLLADQKQLSPSALSGVEADLRPFGQIRYLPHQGAAPEPGMEYRKTAPWLETLARRRASSSLLTLRPLPPGLEAGKADLRLEPSTPSLYFAVVRRTPDGGVLVAKLDLDYIHGPWLKKRLERSPLGDSLSSSPSEEFEDEPDEPGRESILVPTFFADDAYPFPALKLRVDHRHALAEERRLILGGTVLAAFAMAAFALAIAGTVRAVRAELAYAQARARFTDMVGHELRTPVSAISMYAEILREGMVEDPEKLASYHGLLKSQVERLESLIERVLTFARLESDLISPRREPVLTLELVEKACQGVASLGHPVVVSSHAETTLETDPEVALQVLVNLLENAIKHSGPSGSVSLQVEAGQEAVEFLVLDRGPGVPTELREQIFLPYRRGAAKRSRSQTETKKSASGLGLGLAVARGLARSLGGRVEYRERAGGGSIFAMILPHREQIDL